MHQLQHNERPMDSIASECSPELLRRPSSQKAARLRRFSRRSLPGATMGAASTSSMPSTRAACLITRCKRPYAAPAAMGAVS